MDKTYKANELLYQCITEQQ